MDVKDDDEKGKHTDEDTHSETSLWQKSPSQRCFESRIELS